MDNNKRQLLQDIIQIVISPDNDFSNITEKYKNNSELLKWLKSLKTELEKKYFSKEETDDFIFEVSNHLLNYANNIYNIRLPFANNDTFDSLITAVNFLGEELNFSTVTTHYLNDIFNSTGDIIIVVDKDGTVLFANSTAIEILEYVEYDLKLMNISELMAQKLCLKKLIELQEKSQSVTLKSSSGVQIPVLLKISDFSRKDNPMMGYVIIGRDLTLFHKYQKTSEEYKLLFENIAQGFLLSEIVYDDTMQPKDLKIINVNPALTTLVGIERSQMIDLEFQQIRPGFDQKAAAIGIQIALGGEPVQFEYFFEENNKYFDVWVFSPQKNQCAVFLSDITDRKMAQALLIDSKIRYNYLLRNTSQQLYLHDLEGNIIDVNDKSVEISEYSKDELRLMNIFKIDILSAHRRDIKNIWNDINPFEKKMFESIYKNKSGSEFFVEVTLTKIVIDKKEQILTLVDDISERRDNQAKIERMNRRLIEINHYAENLNVIEYDFLYPYIVNSLKSIAKVSLALISTYDNQTQELVCRHFSLSKSLDSKVTKLLGRKIEGFRTKTTPKLIDMMSREVIGNAGTLTEVTFGQIPKPIAKAISSITGIKWYIGIALFKEDVFLGTILLGGTKDEEPIDKESFLAFSGITSNAIVRINAEKDLKQSAETFKTLFEDSYVPILLIEGNTFVSCNQAVYNILKCDPSYVIGRTPVQISPKFQPNGELSYLSATKHIQIALSQKTHRFEWVVLNQMEQQVFIEVMLSVIHVNNKQMLHASWFDITDRKIAEEKANQEELRLRQLIELIQLKPENQQQFLDMALARAIELTSSKIGYIYFYDEESKLFELNSWSKDVMKECEVLNPQTCYELDKTGVWGETVRQRKPIILNEFQQYNPLKKGHPEGHVQLLKFLTIPVINNEKIVAVVAVANKHTDYTDSDVLQLTLLMESVWKEVERLKSEGELAESEERFRLLHNASFGGIIIHDQGIIVECNQGLCDITGYSYEEMIGMNGLLLLSDSCRQKASKNISDGYEKPYECFGVRKNGEIYPVRVEGRSIPYHGKQLRVTEFRDITDQKEAERQVLESEEKFRMLVTEMSQGLAVHEGIYDDAGNMIDYRFIDVNTAFEKITGLLKTDIIGKTILEVLPKTEFYWIKEYEKVLKTGIPLTIENFANELNKYFEVVVYRNSKDQFATIFSDITERKTAEIKLQESERRLSTLMDNLPGIAYRCKYDEHYTMEFLSDGCKIVTGYEPNELKENAVLSFYDIIHPDDTEMVSEEWEKALHNKQQFACEYRIIRKEGELRWVWEQGCGVFDGENVVALEGFITDISERKAAQELIIERENRLSVILKTVPIGIGVVKDRIIQQVNSRIIELTGYTSQECVGRNSAFLYPDQEEFNYVGDVKYKIIKEKGQGSVETRWKRKDGKVIDVILSSAPINPNDISEGVIFSVLDITESKKMQNDLVASEEKYRYMAENISDVIWQADLNLNVYYISSSIKRLTGETPQEHIQKKLSEKLNPDAISEFIQIFHEELLLENNPNADKNRSRIVELEHKHKNGHYIWVSMNVSFIRDENGNAIGIQGISRDIHEKKLIEIELEKSNRVFTHSLDMLCIAGFDGYFKTINPAWEKTLGWSAKEFTSKPWINFVHPDDIEKTKNIKLTTLDNGVDVYSFENRYICKDGSVKWLSWNSYPYVQENVLIGVARDITERKKEEELIQSHYTLMKIAGETAIIGGWSVDLQSNISSWSDVVADIHEEPRGTSTLVSEGINYYTPEYREKIAEVFKKCAEDGIAYDEVMQIITAKGNLKWVRTIGEALRNKEGQIVKVFGAFQDITKSKENEQKLHIATRQLQLHLENSPLAVIEWDADFKVKRWTAQAETIFGWTESEVLGKHPSEWNFIFDEDAQNVNIEIEGLLNKRFSKHTNYNRNITKDGNVIHCEWFNSVVADENDNLMSILSLIQDVTDKIKTSEELMQRERTLQQIFDILPVGLWYADENGKLLSGNPAGIKIWGAEPLVDPAEYGVFKAKRLPSREEIQPHDWALAKTIQTGTTITDEILEIEAFDGKIKTILNYTAPIFDNKEKIIGAIVVNQDITDLKNFERQLRRSAENWNQTFDAIQDGIALLDENQHIIQTNNAFQSLIGEFPEDFIGCQCHLFVHHTTDPVEDCPFIRMQKSKKREMMEMLIGDKICNVMVDPIFDEKNKIIGAVHIISDITEQKKSQLALDESNKLYKLITDKISDVVWLMDLKGNSTFVSPSIKKFTGFSVEEYLQQSIETRFAPQSALKAKQMFQNEFENYFSSPLEFKEFFFRIELQYICKDGTTKWGELLITPYFSNNKELIGLHGVTRDITQRIEKEKEMQLLSHRQKVIADTLLTLNNINDIDELFKVLCRIVYENATDTYVLTVKLRHEYKDLVVVSHQGAEKYVNAINTILGIDLNEFSVKLTDYESDTLQVLTSGEFVHMKKGLRGITGRRLPKFVINQIEKLLNIQSLCALGITINNELFGGIALLHTTKEHDEQMHEFLEVLIGNASTIIQNKWLANELKVSQTRYKTFFDSSESFVYLKDSNLKYILINDSLRKFFDRNEDTIIGATDFQLMPKHEAKICRENDLKALENENVTINLEYSNNRIFQSIKFKVPLSNGEIGIGGYITDVTREKQFESDLLAINKINESINSGASLEEIIADLGHYINAEFSSNHVDILFASDDETHLTYKRKYVNVKYIRAFEKLFGVKIPDEIKVDVHPENWYGKLFSENLVRIVTEISEIQEITEIWINSNNAKIPFKKYLSKIAVIMSDFTSMISIPMLFNSRIVGLVNVSFKHQIDQVSVERLKRLTDQLIVIIARKRSEDSLRRTQELLKETQGIAQLGGWFFDLNSQNYMITNQLLEILGTGSEKTIQSFNDILNFFSPQDAEKLNKAFIRLAKTGQPIDFEMPIFRTTGERVWIRIIGKPQSENGKISRIVGYIMNVDDRLKAEMQVRESENKYRTLIEISTDAIFINLNNTIVFVNPSAVKLFGASNENEILGKSVFTFFHSDFHDLISERIENIMTKNTPAPVVEQKLITKDGRIVDVEVSGTPFSYKESPAIQVIVRDITERKNMQNAILNAGMQSEEKERERIAKELHDGVAPLLSSAKLYAQLHLAKNKEKDINEELSIQSIGMIDDAISTISEISRNISPHVLNHYGLSRALESFISKIRPTINAEIHLHSELNERYAPVCEISLYRIAIELINNAVKHAIAKKIQIDIVKSDTFIIMVFSHNGIGFDWDQEILKASGMGLLNIFNRARSLSGNIKWTNKKDEGMIVRIEIPILYV